MTKTEIDLAMFTQSIQTSSMLDMINKMNMKH